MIKILWISLLAPYDKVAHAGGKIHNYLLKYLKKSGQFDLYLISFAKESEKESIDLDQYNISNDIQYASNRTIKCILRKMINALFGYTKFQGKGTFWNIITIKRKVRIYKMKNENPDVVILHWTSVGEQILWLKKKFPNAKFIIIEEDVSYLKESRKAANKVGMNKIWADFHYKIFKKCELKALSAADLVVLNNVKDCDLIIKDGIDSKKTFVCVPYFNNMSRGMRHDINKDILFFGAMNRKENSEAAIWFINNVFKKLLGIDKNLRFVIVGGNPPLELIKMSNEHVLITGFIDDVSKYFEESLCCVAPLLMGAGVKIKVLEGLSSGIPVLTNDIGIEGIPAQNTKEYLHCTTEDDYINAIKYILNNKTFADIIGLNAKKFIREKYNYEKSASAFADLIHGMVQ